VNVSNLYACAVGSALLLAVAGVAAGPGTAAAAGLTCATAQGPFHVAGTEVLGAGGRAYIPYGITVPGLANAAFRNYTVLDDAKINATAADWCANTVRLQVSQASLVGTSGS
jgi:hypothetical protein